jgi:very-short-patch-repair endonuclease
VGSLMPCHTTSPAIPSARELRRSANPAERLLWRYLCGGQLSVKFSRQMPVGPYYADFLCRELKLIVELDGHSHDVAPQWDIARDAWLIEAGYRLLHFSNEDVMGSVEAVATAIRSAVDDLAHP